MNVRQYKRTSLSVVNSSHLTMKFLFLACLFQGKSLLFAGKKNMQKLSPTCGQLRKPSKAYLSFT